MWAINGCSHHCCMNGSRYSLRRCLLASKHYYCSERCLKCRHYIYMKVCNIIVLVLECIYPWVQVQVILYIVMLIRWPATYLMHCNNLCCFSLVIHCWHSRTQQAQNNKTKWSWPLKSSGGWYRQVYDVVHLVHSSKHWWNSTRTSLEISQQLSCT